MSNFTLKVIAMVCMLIDHVGAIFLPGTLYYMPARYIGRLAFPIFCFLIVQGLLHTRNVYKYLLRLGIFALISEIPFDLALRGAMFDWSYQNVFFTLAIGLAMIAGFHAIETKFCTTTGKDVLIRLIGCLALLYVASNLAELIHCDYGAFGILVIAAFYLLKDNRFLMILLVGLLLGSYNEVETYAIFSLALIWFYNGKRGPSMKYVFYAFYPVHLLVLYGITLLM